MLLLNILLALVWTFLTGEYRPASFFVGFAFGYLILWLCRGVYGPATYFRKPRQVIGFTAFFLYDLVRSNLRVAFEVMRPSLRMRPGIVAVPVDVETDAGLTLLANLITVTPGALSLEVSDDRRVLYVHSMYLDDPEAFRREIKDGFERRVMELLE